MMITPPLDTPLSRPDSMTQWMSQLSFQRGISSFFSDDIPFSWSTGNAFADIVMRYIQLVMQHQPDKTLTHCYELGAGLGHLSQNVLNRLQQAQQLHNIKWHISDSESGIVTALKNNSAFSEYSDQIQFDTMPLDEIKVSRACPPHFLVLSYVMDALPHHQLVWENGTLKEEKIITHLNGHPLLDTSVQPFQAIASEQVIDWIDKQEKSVLLQHLHRLKRCFTETVQCESSVSISKDEQQFLIDYFTNKQIDYCRFNYSQSIVTALKKLLKNAPKTCVWLIQDVADITPEGTAIENDLTFTYGVGQYFRLYFPLIRYIAEQFNCRVSHSQLKNGKTQHLIIYRGIEDADVQSILDETAKIPFTENEIKVENTLNDESISASNDDFHKTVAQLMQTMNPNDMSYSFILVVAVHYYCKQNYSAALQHTATLIEDYGDFAVSAKRLHGQCLIALGQYDKAETIIDEAITVAPFVSDLYLHKSIIYAKKGNYLAFIETVYQYLATIVDIPLWTHMVTLIIVLAHQENSDRLANQYKDQIMMFAESGVFNVPDQVIKRLNQLQVESLT